jgi:hypothetical protein
LTGKDLLFSPLREVPLSLAGAPPLCDLIVKSSPLLRPVSEWQFPLLLLSNDKSGPLCQRAAAKGKGEKRITLLSKKQSKKGLTKGPPYLVKSLV